MAAFRSEAEVCNQQPLISASGQKRKSVLLPAYTGKEHGFFRPGVLTEPICESRDKL
jgi:hypothetical protein